MSRAPIADAIQDVIRVYQASLLLANGGAIDTEREVVTQGEGGHHAHDHKYANQAPSHGRDVPLSVWLEEQVRRLAVVAHRRLELETGVEARPAVGDSRSAAKKEETKAILAEVDRDPTEVAYFFGRTTDAIKQLRKRHGRNPEDGRPLTRDERPLTAPAREQLHTHLNATTNTEER